MILVMVVRVGYLNKGSKLWSTFEMFYEEPVPLPVMATLAAIFTVMRFSSRCSCAVVDSTAAFETIKLPQLGVEGALLLISLFLVIAVHWLSLSTSSTTAMEKGLCWDYSWVLLSLLDLFLLYMALKQRSFRQSLFLY
ncbi:hypothetical protein DITRI_Ditri14bG0097100 [Diplodiscus trichospermus]